MNTKNNQRHQNTIAAIEAAFISLLKEKELKESSEENDIWIIIFFVFIGCLVAVCILIAILRITKGM